MQLTQNISKPKPFFGGDFDLNMAYGFLAISFFLVSPCTKGA
uniref:Uncharacterized protein n=1 Tax=Rhizophora mucronata TaxID=61149 RepID=A0A2P2P860_RHIMU